MINAKWRRLQYALAALKTKDDDHDDSHYHSMPPQKLKVKTFIGSLEGVEDNRLKLEACAIDKGGGDVKIDLEISLAKKGLLSSGTDPRDISLYGAMGYVMEDPDGHIIMKGTLEVLPQVSLQPRCTYLLKDFATGKLLDDSNGTAGGGGGGSSSSSCSSSRVIITAKNDPRTKHGEVILPEPVELPFSKGVLNLTPHLASLPDGVLTLVASAPDYEDSNEVTVVKYHEVVVCTEECELLVKSAIPWTDLKYFMVGECRAIKPNEHALTALKDVADAELPLELRTTVKVDDSDDIACDVDAFVKKDEHGHGIIEFSTKIPHGSNELDIHLYGQKNFELFNSNDEKVMRGCFTLRPQASLQPRASYILRNCVNNQPIEVEGGVIVVSAKDDPRTIAGQHVMDDMEVSIFGSSFNLPVSLIPDAVLTLTPKVEGFIATGFQVVEFHDHVNRQKQRLFLNPLMAEPGQCRVTLAWGPQPKDLDIHIITTEGEEIYYSTRKTKDASVKLDVDARNGYGPETLTFSPKPNVKYRVFVKNFSGEGILPLSKSQAQVFYTSYGAENDFGLRVPTDHRRANCPFWDCFEIEDGVPRIINKLVRTAPNYNAFQRTSSTHSQSSAGKDQDKDHKAASSKQPSARPTGGGANAPSSSKF